MAWISTTRTTTRSTMASQRHGLSVRSRLVVPIHEQVSDIASTSSLPNGLEAESPDTLYHFSRSPGSMVYLDKTIYGRRVHPRSPGRWRRNRFLQCTSLTRILVLLLIRRARCRSNFITKVKSTLIVTLSSSRRAAASRRRPSSRSTVTRRSRSARSSSGSLSTKAAPRMGT